MGSESDRRRSLGTLLSRWLPPILWMALISLISSRSRTPSVGTPGSLIDLVFAKTGHVVEYGILAGLLWRALRKGGIGQAVPFVGSFIIPFAGALLFAMLDEYHQTFVPGREGRWMDVGIDGTAALLTLVVIRQRH